MRDDDDYESRLQYCTFIPGFAFIGGVLHTLSKGNDVIFRAIILPAFGFVLAVPYFIPVAIASAVLLYISVRTQKCSFAVLAAIIVSFYWFSLVVECNKIDHIGISPFM